MRSSRMAKVIVDGTCGDQAQSQLRHSWTDGVCAAVLGLSTGQPRGSERERKTAVMAQIGRRFVPQVLVVARGTLIEFPNEDAVSHQVYSFSLAKKFQLPLYKGQKPAPILFDQAGLVVLGCNIHDNMVGYIYVTEAPAFGETNASGSFDSPPLASGKYRIDVWSPRIAESVMDGEASLTREVSVDGTMHIDFLF
jgi:plastocyanin